MWWVTGQVRGWKPRPHQQVTQMAQGVSLGDSDLDSKLQKSETLEKVSFEASVHEGVQAVFKKDDEFVIWGPASVEIVDKEGDKISVEALGDALPQLLRRARLSLDHTDQIVGRILERFETSGPVEIEVNGQRYEREEFPTDVLELDDGEPAALYVAGEVYNDTQQSKRARERIEGGELTSYSISGEALVTRKKVDSGRVYDDVLDIDLSAVTLCEEGMNQGASYSKVEGEVSDKELAGEASSDEVSKREEVPVLEHPSMQGVRASQPQGGAQQETASVSKSDNMTDNPEDGASGGGAKSDGDGATVEDVLKRLPDEGEIATKDDLNEIEESAVKSVQDALPEGDLATTKYVDQLVEEKMEERVDEIIEAQDEEDESSDEDEEPEDEESKGDYEDEEDEDDEEDKEGPPDEDVEEDGDEEPEPEPDPDPEGEGEDDEDEMERLLQRLEDELPSDVWEVVREYVKGDVDEDDIDFDGFGKSDEGDSVEETVDQILKSGGSRAGSATTTPTAEDEDQVEKQYESQDAEKSEGETGNPALAVWD